MTPTAATLQSAWGAAPARGTRGDAHAWLLRVVDAGLVGVILVAPYFFGGRHDLGRLVFVSLIALTATAWFLRQALLPAGAWPKTAAHLVLALAAGLLVLQIVPLPAAWIAQLSPATSDLLPLWNGAGGDAVHLGAWRTLSLTPHETTKSLAMLVSYGLLFVVVSGRIRSVADIQRMLTWIAVSAVCMAAFAILQYFTSNGGYFWFFAHPHRVATSTLSGAFVNRNHFASFLVLAVGPLAALLLKSRQSCKSTAGQGLSLRVVQRVGPSIAGASLAFVMATILATASRGGAAALLVASGVLTGFYTRRGLLDSRAIYRLAVLAVVIVGFLSIHGYEQMVRRLDDFTEGSFDRIDHNGIRRKLWAANLAAFQAHPLAGTGAGSHREVYPVYLPESFTKIYTHAENGYLQVASETGLAGILLLVSIIGIGLGWCVACLRHVKEPDELLLFGAAGAGLAASLIHSMVDFIWYIPACMSLTIVLAACIFRLSQLVRGSALVGEAVPDPPLARGRWIELTAVATILGAWSVWTYVGPGIAAVHWDRYLRASVAATKIWRQQMTQLVINMATPKITERESLNDLMIAHLQQTLRWDPQLAQAHLQLAAKYLLKFEISQTRAENALSLLQIRDAALAANFASPAERRAWLERALGNNLKWLTMATDEARRALALSPLEGAGYVYLADLAFLDAAVTPAADSLLDQALRVRPNDADVRYVIGEQAWRRGDAETALRHWSQCFRHAGPHQQPIVFWLAGHIPMDALLATLRPDWSTLRVIWTRYRDLGRTQDLEALLPYSLETTRRQTAESAPAKAAQIWHWQAMFYQQLDQHPEALACLEQAYSLDPNNYAIRHALGSALQAAERFAEAEPHIRWCLARRPADKSLSNALLKISKGRLAQRSPHHPSSLVPHAATRTRQ